jgi:hypothetical protein
VAHAEASQVNEACNYKLDIKTADVVVRQQMCLVDTCRKEADGTIVW